ncbi:PDR/VanB family oxidoreductase [Pseudofrankia sp. BMG5.37]|uniref:PDR/VanB family oxidoreductase n=1 Tax=Pseudofrankia sp. BMG5.37 TaxID=3050035 RepID=UPI002893FABF|nr:PDR/VanB family oxidoreductase [Pseudofrankia sp. BMG5.37]MDT3444551.1 PDR/VanB family oxidoreductase [Pseudofrankia sp. BMG5.37]
MSHSDGHNETELTLVLAGRQVVADGVALLTLEDPCGSPLPVWEPGAHVDLILDDGLVRQYSLCGDPEQPARWQVAVLRERAGRGGSQRVHDKLAKGDRVAVRGPRNNFALVLSPRYQFIAGGIGITPILPMVAATEAAGADWRLLYGGRSRASMAFLDDLTARYGDRVTARPQDTHGLLDLSILDSPVADTLVYCCGPEPLLRAVEDRCRAWPSGSLHVERFSPKEVTRNRPDTDFEVRLERSGQTLVVPAGQSILRTLEEAGVDVLYSCTEGTCGTCETVVLEGMPDHRDSLLTEEEQAANDTMFICVSRSRTPVLVLDL